MISKKIALTAVLLSSSVLLSSCDWLDSESHNTPVKDSSNTSSSNTSSIGSTDNTPAETAQIPVANTSSIGRTEESKTTNPVEENSALIQSGVLYEKWQEAEKKLDKITPEGDRLKAKLNDLRTKYKDDESNPEIKAVQTEIEEYLYGTFSVPFNEYINARIAYHKGIEDGLPIPPAAVAKKLKKLELNKVVIPAAKAN
ncbi:hypothetical protein [Candidatus Liberibacter solanacearum]|uniref:Lipoprotein n=1 Tax=Candidatus Liberibacter solanacearum TaxID=556287 RepID=A0A1V2N9F9_9HYPH|nr:hypothetical protein [Candidatus Liberibacter solanacearum]ONI60303.1 hypothetical protein AYO25_00350 [Candidatus Liberibacter solanacearum]